MIQRIPMTVEGEASLKIELKGLSFIFKLQI